MADDARTPILLTGASGRVGRMVRHHWPAMAPDLALTRNTAATPRTARCSGIRATGRGPFSPGWTAPESVLARWWPLPG